MKKATFTISRSEIDHLIHNLKALAKKCDDPKTKERCVAVNLIKGFQPRSLKDKLFKRYPMLTVIIQIDRYMIKEVATAYDNQPKRIKND